MSKSDLEAKFLAIYRLLAEEQGLVLVEPVREFRFCERRWRFDFAWPPHLVAVEIDGGIFVGGRHVDPMGGHNDRTKYNAAVALGWKVLRYDARHLRDDPAGVFEEVMETLGAFA
jgi:very-short-patch-repair endonuclease